MSARRKAPSKRHPSRQVQAAAFSVLGLGVGLFVLSMVMASSRSYALQAIGKGLRGPLPYLFLLGIALLVVYVVMRPKPEAPAVPKADPPFSREPLGPVHRSEDREAAVVRAPVNPTESERRTPSAAWSARVFDDIEWRRFEAVCEALFAQAGFEAKTQLHGADGGVDIWLHSRNAEGPAAVVQCKHWNGRQVGVKEIREFFGVMASHKLKRGTYATTSGFTDDALRFAKENGISAMDGTALLSLIAKRTPEQQQALLRVAYEGAYWRPTCASCGIKMVERTPKKGGAGFWGCAQYPRCKSTLPMRGGRQ